MKDERHDRIFFRSLYLCNTVKGQSQIVSDNRLGSLISYLLFELIVPIKS